MKMKLTNEHEASIHVYEAMFSKSFFPKTSLYVITCHYASYNVTRNQI